MRQDIVPRPGEPGWYDITCGGCGEEFGTNCDLGDMQCPECEARRCPHCGQWYESS